MKTNEAPNWLVDQLLDETYALLRGAAALRCLRTFLYEADGKAALGMQERDYMVFLLDAVAESIETCASAWVDHAEVGTKAPG